MTRIAFAAALALVAILPAASAQAQRTFVSAAGNDSNPCSFAAPCRHFQAAVNATPAGGEVDALDPAGYGPITIGQAITIEGQGWSYIAPPAGGNAITINAGGTDNVVIHGVSLNGAGIGGTTNGIRFNNGLSLTVENCLVSNFTADGLLYVSGAGTLAVSNSYFNDNNQNGIAIEIFGSGVTASIDRSGFFGNHISGFLVGGTGPVAVGVVDSVAANNNSQGFFIETSGSAINLSLTHTLIEGNGIGVEATGTNATIWLAQSTVTGNVIAFEASSSGVINTFQDNYFTSNGPGSSTGTLTNVGKM
jgi:hypothetical protein